MSVQLVIYQVGLIPSQFYGVLSEKNYGKFKELVAVSILFILLNSVVRSSPEHHPSNTDAGVSTEML